MQAAPIRIARRRAWSAGWVAAAWLACGSVEPGASAAAPARAATPWLDAPGPMLPGLDHPPLDGPLVLTGTFGEYRNSHLHAGLDFSTGGVVGKPVYASLGGHVERVRASGAGYGRSIYVRAGDGRLLVYAHLDAFAAPIAAYVAAAQDSGGIYEQDLWPEAGRFRVRAGEVIGWSGRSGTGSPHLHFEVRRGDMAYNPLRAGIGHADPERPALRAVTLEPLDESSWVERGAAPRTLRLAGTPDTVLAEGRLRAIVDAVDPGERRSSMAPYAAGAGWGEHWVEVRFDSASWATDMAELDYVYDRGRAAAFSRTALQLWAPAGMRPRSIRAGVPDSLAAGEFVVRPGDPPRPLVLWARDLAGRVERRTVWLRGPSARESGPDRGGSGGRAVAGRERFAFAPLPGARLRVSWSGAPPGARDARILGRAATVREGIWTAVLPPAELAGGRPVIAVATAADGAAVADTLRGHRTDLLPALAVAGGGGFQAGIADGAPFEASAWVWDDAGSEGRDAGELISIGSRFELLPANLPLRDAARLTARAPGGAMPATAALYRDGGDEGWEFLARVGGAGAGSVSATSRRLGGFALFADQRAPAITPLASRRRAGTLAPYATWSLAARLDDSGSGVDGRASHFVVDGRRAPSEWDAVRGVLRWRPLAPPAAGEHRYEVIAVDRAGNTARRSGTFVLD